MSVGTRLKAVKMVWPKGSRVPVSFSTTLRALPCVAWDRAIELDGPLAQITQPE